MIDISIASAELLVENFVTGVRHEIELMRRNDGDVAVRVSRYRDEPFT